MRVFDALIITATEWITVRYRAYSPDQALMKARLAHPTALRIDVY